MHKALMTAAGFAALSTIAFAQAPKTTSISGTKFITQKDTGMLATNVTGMDVYNDAKENVGKIKDISFEDGKLDGYVLSVGGFLGMGTHYVIVAPSSIKVTYDAGDKKWHALVNASKDEMKNAPAFEYNGKWNASQT